MEPYLETIKQNEPDVTPFFAIADGNVGDPMPDKYESIAGGVVYNKETKTFEEQYKCPELVEMSRVYYDYYQKGYIARDAATKQDGVTECKTGKYAVLRGAGAYSEDGSKSSSVYGNPSIAPGCKFEICQEDDGNKYLKVTVPQFGAFGYYFGTEDKRYAYMTFNYFYPDASKAQPMAGLGYNTSSQKIYVNGNEGGGATVIPSTVTTADKWTLAGNMTYSLVQSPCMGLIVNNNNSTVICIDDIIIWSFNSAVGQTHNSAVPAEVVFENNSTSGLIGIMPDPYTGIAWCNLYNAQSSACTVNLKNYVPTVSPSGKVLAGWSLTDGGNVIKDTMYTAFKVPGDIELYAVWRDETEDDKPKAVVKKEDFEGFTVGQTLTSSDLEFLSLNNFGVGTFTATVKQDEGSDNKYLEIDTQRFGGFRVKNRETGSGEEYWEFNFRFLNDTGSRLCIYAGSDHTGSNQKQAVAQSSGAEWRNVCQGANPSQAALGAFLDDTTGNYKIQIDDVRYWYVPEGLEKNVTVTFANSTANAPEDAVMPASVTKPIYTSTNRSYVLLSNKVPTGGTGYDFIGWSYTDGGEAIKLNEYRFVSDATLYALWQESSKDEGLSYTVTGDTVGISGGLDLTAVSDDAVMYAACYENSLLVGVKQQAVTKGENNNINISVDVSKTPDTVKVFVWGADGNNKSLMNAVPVVQQANE